VAGYSSNYRRYIVVVCAVTLLMAGYLVFTRVRVTTALAFFLLLTALLRLIPIDLDATAQLDITPSADLSAIILLGPHAAMISALLGRVLSEVVHKERWKRSDLMDMVAWYRSCESALATLMAGFGYRLLESIPPRTSFMWVVVPLSGAAIVYYIALTCLKSLEEHKRYRVNFWIAFRVYLRSPLGMVVNPALGLATAAFYYYQDLGGFGIMLFVVSLLVVIYATRLFVDMKVVHRHTIEALVSSIEDKEPLSRGHSINTAHLAAAIARKMGLDEAKVTEIYWAGLLHDVGNLGTDERLLAHPGPLREDQFALIQNHCVVGAGLVSNVPFLKNTERAILYHHEHYDGTGYPVGLAGNHIPLEARVLACAEAFDAMIQDRPYRRALPLHEAYEEIVKMSGRKLDPDVVAVFKEVFKDIERMGLDVFRRHHSLDTNR